MLEKCEYLHKSRWKNEIEKMQKMLCQRISTQHLPYKYLIVLFYNNFASCSITIFYDIYASGWLNWRP